METIFEYYINGKLWKATRNPNQIHKTLRKKLRKKGYELQDPQRDNNEIYVNISKYKVAIVRLKLFTGFYDKNKNKLFENDKVKYKDMIESLCGLYKDTGCYIRHEVYVPSYYWPNVYEFKFKTQKEFNELEKVKDSCNFPKTKWKSKARFSLKEL